MGKLSGNNLQNSAIRRSFNRKSHFSVSRLPRPTSSFQRTPAVRVCGPADQQLHRQRVLGASAPERAERPHSGVQGETRDAQDGSEGGGAGKKKEKVEQAVLAVWEFVMVPTFLLIH